MRSLFLAAIVATTFLTPVSAAELTAQSQIDAVTVYPQGAEVTRVATADLVRGDHSLILDNLPGDVDPQSIRVEVTWVFTRNGRTLETMDRASRVPSGS